jgi:hypothetical protein
MQFNSLIVFRYVLKTLVATYWYNVAETEPTGLHLLMDSEQYTVYCNLSSTPNLMYNILYRYCISSVKTFKNIFTVHGSRIYFMGSEIPAVPKYEIAYRYPITKDGLKLVLKKSL